MTSERYLPVVAIDCEMVGCGPQGDINALGRVSVVDEEGHVLLDEYVRPQQDVTDYRTKVSGISSHNLSSGVPFAFVRDRVTHLLEDKIVVGHALHNDFNVLAFHPPPELVRDTSFYKPLRGMKSDAIFCGPSAGNVGRYSSSSGIIHRFNSSSGIGQKRYGNFVPRTTPALRKLVKHWFNEDMHDGAHDSVEDARMALRLYLLVRQEWESRLSLVLKPYFVKWNLQSPVSLPLSLPLDMHAKWMERARDSVSLRADQIPSMCSNKETERTKDQSQPQKGKSAKYGKKRSRSIQADTTFCDLSDELKSNRRIALAAMTGLQRSRRK